PGARTVQVKTAHGYFAADSLSPTMARERIRAAAAETVEKAGELRALQVPDELRLEIDMPSPVAAEQGALIPGMTRTGDRTVAGSLADPREVLGVVNVCYQLAAAAAKARSVLFDR
ncbi:M55 family metallopeptidase, partial [Streptosporangium algeriense]